jgi:hypothetical protein
MRWPAGWRSLAALALEHCIHRQPRPSLLPIRGQCCGLANPYGSSRIEGVVWPPRSLTWVREIQCPAVAISCRLSPIATIGTRRPPTALPLDLQGWVATAGSPPARSRPHNLSSSAAKVFWPSRECPRLRHIPARATPRAQSPTHRARLAHLRTSAC